MKYSLCLLCIALVSCSSSAAPILMEMGTSARAVALGGAFAALADDESAVFYNPAGLAFLDKITIAAFYQRAFDVVHHIAVTGAMRHWGGQFIQIDTGPIESTNEFGNPVGEPTRYASSAGLVGGAWGIENFAVGLRGKLSSDAGETQWGVDAGALARLGSLRVGAVAENLLGSAAISVRVGAALVIQLSAPMALTISGEVWGLFRRRE